MVLSDYPPEKLKSGIEVLSACKQIRGRVIEVRSGAHPTIVISWNNGMQTANLLRDLHRITVDSREDDIT